MNQAGLYSALRHYLVATEATKSTAADVVVPEIRKEPVSDFFADRGIIREDGEIVHDYYLFRIKRPTEAKGEWDFYNYIKAISAAEAYAPIAESTCRFVSKT